MGGLGTDTVGSSGIKSPENLPAVQSAAVKKNPMNSLMVTPQDRQKPRYRHSVKSDRCDYTFSTLAPRNKRQLLNLNLNIGKNELYQRRISC